MFIRNRLLCLCLATFVGMGATPAVTQDLDLPARFTAFAVTTGGPLTRAAASQVEISVTRWSTEAETQRLVTTLREKGADALLEALKDAKSVGTIRTPGSLAYDLRYAQSEELGDGIRRIVLATDRPMSFYEVVNRPPSVDYPFTFIELRVNAQGEGEGKLAVASAISATPSGRVTVTNYDTQPVQLNEVRRIR